MYLTVNISNKDLSDQAIILSEVIHINASLGKLINGKDGITPHIGDNGNWWIGDIDTNVPTSAAGGVNDYDKLENRPSINNVVLTGNKNLAELGIENYDDTNLREEIRNLKELMNGLPDKNYVNDAINKTVGGINIVLTQINGR